MIRMGLLEGHAAMCAGVSGWLVMGRMMQVCPCAEQVGLQELAAWVKKLCLTIHVGRRKIGETGLVWACENELTWDPDLGS